METIFQRPRTGHIGGQFHNLRAALFQIVSSAEKIQLWVVVGGVGGNGGNGGGTVVGIVVGICSDDDPL